MKINLKVWRQKSPSENGHFENYVAPNVSPDQSFLEMMDTVNQDLIKTGKDPIEFDHDCREGICGMCSMVINGDPHGPVKGVTTCQLHMRSFKDGDEIAVEPFRAKAFPLIKDLKVNRSAFDEIIKSGGYISVNTGSAPDANQILVPKEDADLAFLASTCIGCGACVAACSNSSAMLFTSAKVSHMALLPPGQVEKTARVINMVETMDRMGFGNCSNTGACELACPKSISLENIARVNSEYLKASLVQRPKVESKGE
jgi:succinate dehydrogenase / fumarate reductase, iron-sulfur subunit